MRTSTPGGYFAHVDGLRAIAVLAVMAYHVDARWLPGGFTGVDVFFAISGFVVSAAIDRLPHQGAGAELLRFYARRIRRIAPALLLCLLGTALLSMLFIPESWLSETSDRTGRFAFLGLSNWVLATTGNDYFSPRVEFNPYTHTWSLGVEEQFYLLFPMLFLPWRRGGAGRWVSVGLFALATGASLWHALAQAQVAGREVASFYLTTTRFWQLGLGVLLYQGLSLAGPPGRAWCQAGMPLPSWLRQALLPLALAAIGYGLWAARPGHSPWPDGLWPVLGTLAVIALLHQQHVGAVAGVLGAPGVVAIGRWSYSLYLWHWPVLVVLRWTVGLDSPLVKLFAVTVTFALAIGSYRWVETPWRQHRRLAGRHGRVVLVGLACLLVGGGVQMALANNAPRYLSLSTVSRHPLDWYAYARSLRKEMPVCRQVSENRQVEGVLVRKFSRGACDLPPGNGRSLFVVGDSHAVAYNELLRRYAVVQGEPVHLYAVGGCAVANLPQWPDGAAQCEGFLRAALADVAVRARPGDVLLLPGLRVLRLADQDQRFAAGDNLRQMRLASDGAGSAARFDATVAQLRPLAARGVRIVFEAPKPVFPAPPYRCADWFNRGNAVCAGGLSIQRSTMEAYRAPAMAQLQRLVAALPGASLWDPLPALCGPQACAALRDGRPLFFDADHLSGHGNRVLLPVLREHLARNTDPPAS